MDTIFSFFAHADLNVSRGYRSFFLFSSSSLTKNRNNYSERKVEPRMEYQCVLGYLFAWSECTLGNDHWTRFSETDRQRGSCLSDSSRNEAAFQPTAHHRLWLFSLVSTTVHRNPITMESIALVRSTWYGQDASSQGSGHGMQDDVF